MEPVTFDTAGQLYIEVRIPSGDVVINTDATTKTVLHVKGEKDPDDIDVSFDDDGSTQRLVVAFRKRGLINRRGGHSLQVHLTTPPGAHVQVTGGSTDLKAKGSLGSVDFQSGSGDACLDSVTGDVVAKVASGDVIVGSVGGLLTFHSASGDLKVGVANGRVKVRTASGDVAVTKVAADASITTVSGDIELSEVAAGEHSLQAVSGDVQVALAAGTGVFLDLSSLSGSTTSDLQVSDQPGQESESVAHIKAATVSGDIRIRKSSVVRHN